MLIKKHLKYFTALTITALTANTLYANNENPRAAIKANGQLVYFEKQQSVDNLTDMFKEGNFYGRLRNNNFYFWYDDSASNTHFVSGIGASAVYKSANLNGLDFTLGLYGTRAVFNESAETINTFKPGKDTLSRYEYANTGSKALYTFGQLNLSYKFSKTKLTFGRQLVETFYTKSNDTKMIPNTFDGVVVESKDLQDSTIKLAYLTKQKLRDHQDAHSVLMYGDANSSSATRPEWSANDDSAMHKGLTYTALRDAGKATDAPLIILDAQNNSFKNLQLNFASYEVPELLAQVMGEANYKIDMNSFSINPGIRYIHQFDNGSGNIGGASLTGDTTGYKNANSLDAQMIAARLVTKIKDYKINLGYTNILDQADLVTPWRGFPTVGYTRSMGIYNWRANTKSYRIELVKGANKTGIYKDGFIQTSVLYVEGDQAKSEADKMFYYFGYIRNLASYPEFQYRFRFGYNQYIRDSDAKSDFIDSRIELNYTF